jgi:DHA2 family multidrug resistance protein
MFRRPQLATGLFFIFVIGIMLLASLALLPPMLSRIFGYPVITTGLVMAPRGVGTMISMLLVGRLVRVVDPRKLVVAGLLLTALSLWEMTGFSPQMDAADHPLGVVQGLGLGLVFVPLSTVAFATLAPQLPRRCDQPVQPGAQHRLVDRDLGRHLLLTRNIQVNHAELAAAINPFNPVLRQLSPAAAVGGDASALSSWMASSTRRRR